MATITARQIDGIWTDVEFHTGAVVGVHEHHWIIMGGRNGLYRCAGCPAWAKDDQDANEQDRQQTEARQEANRRRNHGVAAD